MDENKKFWMVWRWREACPMIKLSSFFEAKEESSRLAKKNPGCKFYVLEASGFCKTSELVTWEDSG